MARELSGAEASVAKDIISGLQDAMKHIASLATAVVGAAGAVGVWNAAVRPSTWYLAAVILLLGAVAMSLAALILLPLMHASITDPHDGLVSDNKGTFAAVTLAFCLFVLGAVVVMLGIAFSSRS